MESPQETVGENGLGNTPVTMKAVVQHRYGVGNIEVRDVETPVATEDRVLIKVHSSSVNAYEWHMTSGKPYFMRLMEGLTKPKQSKVGADISGTVVATGPDVTRFTVGDEVFGDIGFGAYAEYAITREANLARKPGGVSFEDAAAAPLAGLTALQGLRDLGNLQLGQNVLVVGASGGVGTYAVQIAKAMGAEVTAVCSTQNVETAKSIGADRVIDYTKEDFINSGEKFDLIFDGPANSSLRKLRKLMKPDGTYVMFGGPKGRFVGPLLRLIRTMLAFRFWSQNFAGMFLARVDHEDLARLGELLESGEIEGVIVEKVDLDGVKGALERQGEFHARGKTVVTV